MKTNITPKLRIPYCYVAILFLFVINIGHTQDSFTTYKGEVVNEANNDPLVFATLSVEGTNISTVTNSDGLFTLKVPNTIKDARIVVMYLGFTPKTFLLSSFNKERTKIGLIEVTTQLNEVMVQTNKNAKAIVTKALSNKGENYMNSPRRMMAFYRETIKKRRRNVSLAEAVITVNKESYDSFKSDKIALFKSRKSTDYSKLDTIALKLQGGPLNALYVDVMKYPDYFLNYEDFDKYKFTFDEPTIINDELVYVINFKQSKAQEDEPLYFGTLYINSNTMALTNAIYNLNVENRAAASALFVRRKPSGANVYPTEAVYRVNYRQQNGKWYYGYSNVQIEFVIDWDNKLFNSKYTLQSEMAITDIIDNNSEAIRNRDRFKQSAILVDETSGFTDPDFWGAYNVIEPDKSIESAIDKIQKQLRKLEKS
jgi:hypothetical protein